MAPSSSPRARSPGTPRGGLPPNTPLIIPPHARTVIPPNRINAAPASPPPPPVTGESKRKEIVAVGMPRGDQPPTQSGHLLAVDVVGQARRPVPVVRSFDGAFSGV